MDRSGDRFVTQSLGWLRFIVETQGAEIVVAEVHDGDSVVGTFTGFITRRYGVRILGSPLPGWSTAYQGFNLDPGVSRAAALEALIPFAFKELRCHHLEFRDRVLREDDVRDPRAHIEQFETWDVSLEGSEDDVFGRFSSACRRAVRRAEKVGLTVEVAEPDGFAEEYYTQLLDVFDKQGLLPTYDVDRVQSLVRHLHPAGRVLLLRARDPEGLPVATGIFPWLGSTMFFWGGASLRSGQQHRPNEAIMWAAMRYGREHGVAVLDLGGGGEYKRKYGGENVFIPHVVRTRSELLWMAREWIRKRNDPDNPSGRFAAPGGAGQDDRPPEDGEAG